MTLPHARTPSNLTGSTVPAPGRMSQTTGIRIAVSGVAAPFLCCAAGLAVQALLRHRQSALAADYAARHMAPLPGVKGYAEEPSSFLLGAAPGVAIIARNPPVVDGQRHGARPSRTTGCSCRHRSGRAAQSVHLGHERVAPQAAVELAQDVS